MSRQGKTPGSSRSASAVAAVLALVALQGCPEAPEKADAGFTVESDGDSVVLTPQDPTKAYLVLALSPEGTAEAVAPGALAQVPMEKGQIRVPASGFESGYILEVRAVAEVRPGPAGFGPVVNPCKAGTCDYPLPPCFPGCAGQLQPYLSQPEKPLGIDRPGEF